MKRIKLTKKEEAALKASKRYWIRNVQKPLLEGRRLASESSLIEWVDTEEILEFGDDTCSLCKSCIENPHCVRCPYFRFYGYDCDDPQGHFDKFYCNPCLRTCNAVIRVIDRILEKALYDAMNEVE